MPTHFPKDEFLEEVTDYLVYSGKCPLDEEEHRFEDDL